MARGKQRGRGGYRQPTNPAPVSGPGALSRRTDGGPSQPHLPATGRPYGQRQAEQQMISQAGQPIPAAPPVPRPSTPAGGAPAGALLGAIPNLTQMGTQRPHEPITAGIPIGDGPGPGPLTADPSSVVETLAVLAEIYPNYPDLHRLLRMANHGATGA